MTSLISPLRKCIRSSTTKPLPFSITLTIQFLFLILYAGWLIPIPPLSHCGSCMHPTSALRLTHICSAAMVQSYDLAQCCWVTVGMGSRGSRFRFRCGRGRSLGLSHHDVSCRHRFLLFLHLSHLVFLADPIFCRSSPGCTTKHHSVCPWCRVHSFACGSPSCCSRLSALRCHLGGFTLLCAPAAERNMISFRIGRLSQCVAAEQSQLCRTTHYIALVVTRRGIA